MKNGYFNGFARELEALEGTNKIDKSLSLNASCKIGFWNTTRILSSEGSSKNQFITVSRPHGKWAWIVSDAPENLQAICPEGVYSGEQDK